MKQIDLKKINQSVSAMALGTMFFNTLIDAETSRVIMDTYCENGGNFIDTANMYASWIDGYDGGESEALIGQWMKGRSNRNSLFISTKVGLPMKGVDAGLQKDLILKECENSLKRLHIDTIDLYFAHREDLDTPMDETLEAMYILKKQGKIRHTGVSNHRSYRVAQAKMISEYKKYPEFTFAQYRYTYLRPKVGTNIGNTEDARMHATQDLLDYICENNMNFMCYQTLLGGAYTRVDKQIPPTYLGHDMDNRLIVLDKVAHECDATRNQVILAWVMQNRMQAIPLITGGSKAQIEENINASDIVLTDEQIKRLDEAGA